MLYCVNIDMCIQAYIAVPGLPNSASDTALVTVTVLDINDNNPVFENPHSDTIVLMEARQHIRTLLH